MNQKQIENAIGITHDDAQYINNNRSDAAVIAFCTLLHNQVSCFDKAGWALLEASLADVRKQEKGG